MNDFLTLLAPEALLTVGALTILVLGMIWRDERAYRPLAGVGIVAAAASVAASLATSGATAALPQGMLVADGFTQFFRVIGAGCAAIVLVMALGRKELGNEFPGLLLLATLGILLCAGSANLVMIYVGIELLSITSYVLAGLLRREPRSNEAALKYFFYGAAASAVMLYGLSFFLGLTGAVDLPGIAAGLARSGLTAAVRWVALPGVVLTMVGLGFKIAAVPFHQWSPDVYEGAPTPVTAFLSVGPKAAGFAVMARFFLVALPALQLDWVVLLAALSVVTMCVGNLVALSQTHMKRLLAYSSIAQAGYMLIGLAALQARAAGGGTPPLLGDGVAALLVYLVAYLFTNLGAFTVVQAVEDAAGSDDLSAYTGLVRRAPLVAGAMVFFMLSLVGIPPLACFLGKLFIFSAAVRAELYWLAAIGVVNSAISLAYYFKVVRVMFFDRSEGEAAAMPVAPGLRAALTLTWAGTLGLVIFATPIIAWAARSAEMLAK
ncbi:MAG TPA: NADH-quinone oxidoreductase subunit N [Anaerolineae bacterium]|nr:NADH-quinone oxidoreductase subunit N [Anaerolineae bacterium]